MRNYNSTIKIKLKPCKSCGVPSRIFSRGNCQQCATRKRIQEQDDEEQSEIEVQSWNNLRDDCDTVASLYIRNAAANKDGVISCFTCDKKITVAEAQCSHFIPRANLNTRWLILNLKAACKECNEYKSGNIVEYEKRIGKDTADFLREQGREVYKPTISDLKSTLAELKYKLQLLKRK